MRRKDSLMRGAHLPDPSIMCSIPLDPRGLAARPWKPGPVGVLTRPAVLTKHKDFFFPFNKDND